MHGVPLRLTSLGPGYLKYADHPLQNMPETKPTGTHNTQMNGHGELEVTTGEGPAIILSISQRGGVTSGPSLRTHMMPIFKEVEKDDPISHSPISLT